jgi:hypothetical protein
MDGERERYTQTLILDKLDISIPSKRETGVTGEGVRACV